MQDLTNANLHLTRSYTIIIKLACPPDQETETATINKLDAILPELDAKIEAVVNETIAAIGATYKIKIHQHA